MHKLTIKEEPADEPVKQSLPFNYDTCKWCPYRTKSLSTLLSHVKKHKSKSNLFSCQTADLEAYECPFCHFDNNLKIAVDRHISLVHEEEDISDPEIELKVYTCGRCNFETFSLLLFGEHVSDHENKSHTRYSVGHSIEHEFAYWRQRPKLKYMKIYVPEKRLKLNNVKWFECEQCDYKAKRKSSLKKHVHCHHAEVTKWFECEQCDFKAKAESYLKNHVYYQHSEEIKWFKCEQCDYKAKAKSYLKKHVECQHTEVTRWFECEQCAFKTKAEVYLKKHVYYRHSEVIKWFKCEQCDYKTKTKGSLQSHVYSIHSEEAKWLECEQCSYKTKRKSDLRRHELSKHSQVIQI